MPKMDGIEVLKNKNINKDTVVIMISGHGTIDIAETIRKGAHNFYSFPFLIFMS
jgi:DNA-binding NtrC family response regulator